jgi:hypothetical protein
VISIYLRLPVSNEHHHTHQVIENFSVENKGFNEYYWIILELEVAELASTTYADIIEEFYIYTIFTTK